MSLETTLVSTLTALCPRVYPDIAPAGTAAPYVTYQHIGGPAESYTEGGLPSLRCAHIQINTWSNTRQSALTLALEIETALTAASPSGYWTAKPLGAIQSSFEDTPQSRGYMQDFEIWADR